MISRKDDDVERVNHYVACCERHHALINQTINMSAMIYGKDLLHAGPSVRRDDLKQRGPCLVHADGLDAGSDLERVVPVMDPGKVYCDDGKRDELEKNDILAHQLGSAYLHSPLRQSSPTTSKHDIRPLQVARARHPLALR